MKKYSRLINLVFFSIGVSLNYIFAIMLKDLSRDLGVSMNFGLMWGVLYFGYMALLITPLGDHWLNLTIGARDVTTAELNRLGPLLASLKDASCRMGLSFPKRIQLRVLTDPFPNAMAFGHSTIAVTTGLLKTNGDDEVRAVVAHETGHLVNRDSLASLVTLSAFGPLIWIGEKFVNAFLGTLKDGKIFSAVIVFIFGAIFFPATLSAILFSSFEALKSFTNQKKEFKADEYAVKLTGKDAMVSFLQSTEHLDYVPHGEFLAAYTLSHPPALVRIDHIENLST